MTADTPYQGWLPPVCISTVTVLVTVPVTKWMLAQALFQQYRFNALHQTPKESEYEQHEAQHHQAQTKQHTSPHKYIEHHEPRFYLRIIEPHVKP